MNRIWLFFCFLCIPWIARGQSAYEWNCWFDDDPMPRQSGTAMGDALSIDALANELAGGFHTFHVQVADTAGRYSPPQTQLFYHAGNNSIKKLRYWFDEDEKRIYTISTKGGLNTIDVSHLQSGIHIVYCQVEDVAGKLSDVFSGLFYRQIDTDQLEWSYWFDEDEDTKRMTSHSGETVLIDVSELADGFHTIHHQVRGLASSDVVTRMFIKVPQTENVPDMTCICTVDNKLVSQSKVPGHGGVISWEMDVSSLSVGLHRAQFQVITPAGVASTIAERYFVRVISDDEIGRMKCVYSFDNAETHSVQGTASNGLFHLDLDVSALEDGLHRMSYMMVADDGTTTPHQTAFFWKTPLGGESIVQYDYWLNDDMEHVHKAKPDKRENPFKLISLLPVETYPIRSSCFHFEVKDDQPVIYAKNDFHIRFYDTSGREISETKQYVDYNISQKVKDVEWLEPSVRVTTDKPEENEVKWYCLEAEPGDSLQFKLDRAATIQLFAPSGEEVYNASGSEVVKLNGCHVKEKGTYYLALHDVTATQGNSVSIDYSMIGKYALLAYTPTKFSSNGTTIMYLNGNGLNYVKSIELVNGNEVLYPDTIVANTTDLLARFALNTDIETAKTYTLNVIFNNEDENDSRTITRRDALTLEPANKGDIAIGIETERRVGDPYPIKVTIKNTGNVGYYGIPVDVAFDNPDKLDEFKFVNFNLLLSDTLYNNREFFTYSDNLVGTGKKGFFMPMLVPYLAPYEEKTFVFGVKTKIAHAQFNFYAWAGEPMYDGITEIANASRRRASPCNPSNIPDVYEALDHADHLTNLPINPSRVLRPFIGAAEAIAGIIQGSTRARENAIFDAYGIPESERDDYRFQYRNCVRSPYDIARDAHPFQARRHAEDSGGSTIDIHASSNCPKPEPHGTDVYIPGDPNEITGYLAESGSHYMVGDIKTVSYDIEFENDPELANSSAHSIIIENRLDPAVFDLNSFTPKDITIFNKKIDLSGEQSFVTTLDLRTAINVIAELKCEYNAKTGIITWIMTSLDPISMEPTDDIMQGILPINNYNGEGVGHVTYSVNLHDGLTHGTSIDNKASIVFDNNDAIETPTWTNIIDKIAPVSHVSDVQQLNDSVAVVSIDATDELSGVWRYDVYVQYGEGSGWWKAAENVPADTVAYVKIYEGIDHGFYVVATDSAGNVEVKVPAREWPKSDDDNPTVISKPSMTSSTKDPIYNLEGQQVKQPRKGIFIRRGKKEVMR